MNYQAKKIFDSANNFLAGFNTLNEKLSKTDDIATYAAPIVTLGSFTIELHLKCLYVLDTGRSVKKIHKLDDLYNSLNEESKVIIKMIYERLAEQDPNIRLLKTKVPEMKTEIEDVLDEMSDAFVKWRYSFELGVTSFQGSGQLIDAIRSRIKMLQPDWFEEEK